MNKVNRVCKFCNKKFLANTWESFNGKGIFCSTDCLHKYQKGKPRIPDMERFDRFVKKTDCCWLWCGAVMKNGYGVFMLGQRDNPRSRLAHRASYLLKKGPIPNGLLVLHKCDVRKCVNPDHLFLGTQLDNIRDMDSKLRRIRFGLKGEKSPNAKVTNKIVLRMRYLYPRSTLVCGPWLEGMGGSTSQRNPPNKNLRHCDKRFV